jgi:outer membrane receptor for monomeric catechols
VSALALDGFQRERDQDATLHQAGLFLIYNHPSGFFGQWNGQWFKQVNGGSASPGPGDNFWQFNVFAGYRFPRRRAEVSLGVLNLTDHDYRLNPLNVTAELPRERTLVMTVRVNF